MRPVNPSAQEVFWGMDQEEVSSYVTNLPPQEATPSQIVIAYRKRADAENVLDELKNEWGFSGFCSRKAVVSERAARLILINYKLLIIWFLDRYLCWNNPLNPENWLDSTLALKSQMRDLEL